MRKIVLVILTLILMPVLSYGQVDVPKKQDYYARYFKPQKTYYFYVDFGLSFARKVFGEDPKLNTPLLDPFLGKEGIGGKTGIVLSPGFRFPYYLAQKKLYASFNFGAELVLNGQNFHNINPDISSSLFAAGGVEIGSGISYNFNDKFVLEATFDLLFPLFTSTPEISYYQDGFVFEVTEGHSSEYNYTLGNTLGFAVRKDFARFFIEFFDYRVNKSYAYTFLKDDGYKATRYFNADYDIQTTRVGISFIL